MCGSGTAYERWRRRLATSRLRHGAQGAPLRSRRPAAAGPRPAHGILEAGEGRLGGQGRPRERIAVDQELVHHIVGQPSGVVAVGIATREREHPLPHQFQRLMLHLARLAPVHHTRGQPLRQLQLGIQALQQHRPAVRTGVRPVEDRDDRLPFGLESERDLRYTGCSHRASSRWGVETSRYRFYSTFARLDGSSLSSFVNFPG